MTALMWDQTALMVEVSGGGTPRRGQRYRPESRAIIACKFTSYSKTPRVRVTLLSAPQPAPALQPSARSVRKSTLSCHQTPLLKKDDPLRDRPLTRLARGLRDRGRPSLITAVITRHHTSSDSAQPPAREEVFPDSSTHRHHRRLRIQQAQSVASSRNQWQSVVISGNQWPSPENPTVAQTISPGPPLP